MEPETIAGAVSLIGGIVIWAIRQEGRIDSLGKDTESNKKRVEDIRAEMIAKHTEMRDDIGYIRKRIDEALNGKH